MDNPRRASLAVAGAMAVALAVPIVAQFEGRRLQPYRDLVGKLTWCDGETRGVARALYTPAECDAITAQAVGDFEAAIRPCLPGALPVQVRAAFIVAAYNIGADAFCGSSMARRAKAGDLRGACDALVFWDKATIDGVRVKVRGLTLRRAAERAICLEGLEG